MFTETEIEILRSEGWIHLHEDVFEKTEWYASDCSCCSPYSTVQITKVMNDLFVVDGYSSSKGIEPKTATDILDAILYGQSRL